MLLPSNYTRLAVANGGTIREVAIANNLAYLVPYYLVIKKENVSDKKDVVAIARDGTFYQGASVV